MERLIRARNNQVDSQRDRGEAGSEHQCHATTLAVDWWAVVADGKTAQERLKGKSGKVQGKMFAEEILLNRKSSHRKLTCMCEDAVYGDFIVAHENRFGRSQSERRNRVNLEMIVAVPWREQWRGWQDGRGAPYERGEDGQGPQGEAGDEETCSDTEESVHQPWELQGVWVHGEMSRAYVDAQGNGGTCAHGSIVENEWKRKTCERISWRVKRAMPIVEEVQQRDEGIVRMDEDAPATSSSSSTAAPSSSANNGSDPARRAKRTNIERIPSVCRWRVDDSQKKQEEEEGQWGRKDGD